MIKIESSEISIRPYSSNDKIAVLQLLNLNTPKYFHKSERKDFEKYLEEEIEDYFVVENNVEIIGAGGINYMAQDKTARISWDMIKPNLQGQGIGKYLMTHRLKYLSTQSEIEIIDVRTTQLSFQFYEKMNFKLFKIEKDFWAEGFDLFQMQQENKSTAVGSHYI